MALNCTLTLLTGIYIYNPPVSLWNRTPLIQPQYVDEEAGATSKPKPKPEVKRKPVRKTGLQPLSGGTVGELGEC